MKTLKDLPFLVFSELLSSHVRAATAWAQGTPFQAVPHRGTRTMAVLFWHSCPPRPACTCLQPQPCPACAPGHRRAIWKPGTEELDPRAPNEHRFVGSSNSMSKAQFLILLPKICCSHRFSTAKCNCILPIDQTGSLGLKRDSSHLLPSCYRLNCPHPKERYVQVPTPSPSECDLIYKMDCRR